MILNRYVLSEFGFVRLMDFENFPQILIQKIHQSDKSKFRQKNAGNLTTFNALLTISRDLSYQNSSKLES